MWVKGALPFLSPLDEGLGTRMYVTQAMSPYNHLDKWVTHGTHIMIHDILFGCAYVVRNLRNPFDKRVFCRLPKVCVIVFQ